MSITATGWKNKGGTANRSCACGSWKKHWINNTSKSWPSSCSVKGCSDTATDGAHVINSNVTGERIVPTCSPCNQSTLSFDLKGGVTLVSANKSETCDK